MHIYLWSVVIITIQLCLGELSDEIKVILTYHKNYPVYLKLRSKPVWVRILKSFLCLYALAGMIVIVLTFK